MLRASRTARAPSILCTRCLLEPVGIKLFHQAVLQLCSSLVGLLISAYVHPSSHDCWKGYYYFSLYDLQVPLYPFVKIVPLRIFFFHSNWISFLTPHHEVIEFWVPSDRSEILRENKMCEFSKIYLLGGGRNTFIFSIHSICINQSLRPGSPRAHTHTQLVW